MTILGTSCECKFTASSIYSMFRKIRVKTHFELKNFWYNLAEPEIETKMHNKIMRLTELITVTLLLANKELYKNYAARFP